MSSLEEREIPAQVHGRYVIAPCVGQERPPLLLCFHGYGQSPEEHLGAVRRIPGVERWLLCAVQGLHRFYRVKTGEIVANWMTRQGREQAIADNVRYVSAIVAEVRREFNPSARLAMVGFSQGVAMAYRAAAGLGMPCEGLVVLGGDVPPEVAGDETVSLPPVLLGRGTRDEWYGEAKMTRDLDALSRRAVRVETCVFEGGHEWGPDFVEQAGHFLARLHKEAS